MKKKMKMGGVAPKKAMMGAMMAKPMMEKPMMKMGGSLKSVDKAKNPGLAKLPTAVRNKMGYKKYGGAVDMMQAGGNVSDKKVSRLTKKPSKAIMKGSKDSPKLLTNPIREDEFKTALKSKKMQAGGVVKSQPKRVGPVDPDGAYTKVQERNLPPRDVKTKVSLSPNKQLGATKMMKKGGKVSKKK